MICSFEFSRNCWNWACYLAFSWFVVSFLSCIVCINTSRCIHRCSSNENLNDSSVYVASCCHLPYMNLLYWLRFLHCLSLLCFHTLLSHSFCWNARNSCSFHSIFWRVTLITISSFNRRNHFCVSKHHGCNPLGKSSKHIASFLVGGLAYQH